MMEMKTDSQDRKEGVGGIAPPASSGLGVVALEERVEVLLLVLQELQLLLALALVHRAPFRLATLDRLALVLELHHAGLALLLLLLVLGDQLLRLCLALLGLELLARPEGHAALVERLVGRDRHADLVADPQQEEPTLGAVDRHLADELVEALGVELLADRADARLPGLALHQALVHHLLQLDHVEARGWPAADVLAVVF